ncbi:TetR/AcrR family transcriptional regulator [Heyndrickxia acidiproducens]|jgi:AcrR family transcriptional regulator|uniref:TetR/AcrR family transcriptional regulator n=1 Tax=Heyndrickxia acidiproducens TaxID=1121084 RepID=UPI000360D92E|nr:TetR/AcrR family transcriptional regulator [Heyndrickxia acidiproducens]
MRDRKAHVIKIAHQLFMEKGFQATSIQDILERSGIAKGTFYNYFSSKNELLIALLETVYMQLEQDRDALLLGQDPADIEIFVKQVEMHLQKDEANQFISLYEEVFFSNDQELKDFIKLAHRKMIYWLYRRFIDLFGENKKPYLLDCAIMFTGILQQNLKFQGAVEHHLTDIRQIIRYSVKRMESIVEDVAATGDQLLQPEIAEKWFPDKGSTSQIPAQTVSETIADLKRAFTGHARQPKFIELLDFIQDELTRNPKPRIFLLESALASLEKDKDCFEKQQFDKLKQLVSTFTDAEKSLI